MNKLLLLTKSNFRKNKGTSIGLLLLILIAAALVGLSLLIFFDAYPTASKEAERLNSGSGVIYAYGDVTGFDEKTIGKIIEADTESYSIYDCLGYGNVSLDFGNGTMAPNLLICDKSVFSHDMDRMEIVTEDDSVKENYLYLPYQFFTSGGFNTGDNYSFELFGKSKSFKVRGFINTTYFGCNNCGTFMFVIDDESYADLIESDSQFAKCYIANFVLDKDINYNKFVNSFKKEICSINNRTLFSEMELSVAVFDKTFMSLILAVSFLVLTIILIIVIVMMLSNCISNYVRENMKAIGALKAIGYTSTDIRKSLLLLFGSLSIVGSLLGAALSYPIMPIMAKVIVGQMGVPYVIGFNALSTFVPVAFVSAFVFLSTLVSTGAVKKIDPIIALRNGMDSHNYRKNRISLEKSVFSLNSSLAFKTMLNNLKQNTITFFVVGLLVFCCVLSLLMYENFSRNPKVGILSFENCGGILAVDPEAEDDAREYLEGLSSVSNIRSLINVSFAYSDEDSLWTNIFDDIEKMNNKDVCYKGRLPKYDNEVAVSGKFAKEYGYEIGDEIELGYGEKTYRYLLTGLIQTCNNYGREAVMNMDAAEHIYDVEGTVSWLWFDCKDRETSDEILDGYAERNGEHIQTSMNFFEVLEGNMTTFRGISTLMLVLIVSVSAAIIILVMYLFIKALVYNKRKDYGIYKALGYTSKSLMIQTALSFMPSVIVSILVFSVVSYYLANPYMSLVMGMFGLMKCSFSIPIGGVVIVGIGMAVLAFAFALINSGKIKNIEPVKLITAE